MISCTSSISHPHANREDDFPSHRFEVRQYGCIILFFAALVARACTKRALVFFCVFLQISIAIRVNCLMVVVAFWHFCAPPCTLNIFACSILPTGLFGPSHTKQLRLVLRVCFSRTFFVIFAQSSRGRAALFSVQQLRVSSTDPFRSNSGMSRLGRRSAPSPLSALGTSRTDCCIFSRWEGSLQRLLTKFGQRISKPLFVEVWFCLFTEICTTTLCVWCFKIVWGIIRFFFR